MKTWKILTILALFALLASCRRADPVVGRWQGVSTSGWTEYFPDGDVIFNDGSVSASGTWKRLEDGRIKVDSLVRGSNTAEVYQVAIEGDRAIFTNSMGRTKVYQRSTVTAKSSETDKVDAKSHADESAETDSGQSRDREAQRRTMADIRTTGTAMFSWLTDQVGAAAAGLSLTDRLGRRGEIQKYVPITRAELEKLLVPHYAKSIPETDGWGHPYEYYLSVKNVLAREVMGIRSPGRDGRFSTTEYPLGSFAPNDFDEDIVWTDGFFVRWPEKQEK
ncbi:MAG TPA: hypothetical protein VF173_12640 [Thermoanaerobaculia bacterium]|nr:hypothetical protein [Thermoanaerobaculia bacterium]